MVNFRDARLARCDENVSDDQLVIRLYKTQIAQDGPHSHASLYEDGEACRRGNLSDVWPCGVRSVSQHSRCLGYRQAKRGLGIRKRTLNNSRPSPPFCPGLIVARGASHSVDVQLGPMKFVAHLGDTNIPVVLQIYGQCREFSVLRRWRTSAENAVRNYGQRDSRGAAGRKRYKQTSNGTPPGLTF